MAGKSLDIANASTFAIHHALYNQRGISCMSMSFEISYSESVRVMAAFDAKPNSSMFNMGSGGGTPTANAIWAARAVLLQRKEPRKIIIVLTDGQPDSKMATKIATERVEKDGIEIAAIGINTDCVKKFWKNSRCITEFEKLPQALFGVMEDLLTKKAA
jgi:cobaltochelatase CobT